MRRRHIFPRFPRVGIAVAAASLYSCPGVLMAQEVAPEAPASPESPAEQPPVDATAPDGSEVSTQAEAPPAEDTPSPAANDPEGEAAADDASPTEDVAGDSEDVAGDSETTEDSAPAEALPPSDLPAEGLAVPAYEPPAPEGAAETVTDETDEAPPQDEGDRRVGIDLSLLKDAYQSGRIRL